MAILEAGKTFEEEGHTDRSAELKKYLEAEYKIHVAHAKKLNRLDIDYDKKHQEGLNNFLSHFKKVLYEAGAREKEFLDYHRKFLQELSASHSKVDLKGDLTLPLQQAVIAAREMRSKEIHDVIAHYSAQMRLAEKYRALQFHSLQEAVLAEEDRNKDLADTYRKIAEDRKAQMEEITASAKAELDKRLKLYEKEAEAVGELNKKFHAVGGKNPTADKMENIAEATDMITEGFSDLLSKLKGRDLKGLGEKLKGAGAFGQTLEARATQKDAGGGAKFFGMIGSLLKSFGPMLRIVGALAKGFANVVSFLIDVDSAGKALNKNFLDSASGADALVTSIEGGFVDLNRSLRDIRTGVNDFYLSQQLGVTAEAAMAMVAEFQQAGITLKEMQGAMTNAKDSEEAYVKVIQHMTAQQRILGASVEDVASITERYGYSLEDIAVRFSAITDQAMQSGFGVKRFYSMILQATTGMGIYNTRIEEAAFYATRLGKILGSRGLEQSGLLQKLSQGFKGQGVKENYKAMMMMGDKARKEIFSQEYEARVGNVSRSKDQSALLAEAINTAGLGGKIDMKDLSGSLKKVSVEERSLLLAAIRQQDNGSDMAVGLAKEIGQILQLNVGAQGRAGGAVSAGALGMTGFLKAQQAMMKKFGLTDLRQLNTNKDAAIVYRSFLEEQMGYSGEQADAFIMAMEGLRGDFDLLMKQGPATTSEAKEDQVKKFGAYISENGDLISAQLDENGKVMNEKNLGKADFDAFVRVNEGTLTKATEQRDRNLELSEQIANNTIDIAQRIEMGVTYFLQGIYNILDALFNFFIGSNLDDEGRKRAEEEYKRYDERVAMLEKDKKKELEEQKKIKTDASLTDSEKKEKLELSAKKVEALDKGIEKVKGQKEDFRSRIASKDEELIEDLNDGVFNIKESDLKDLDQKSQDAVTEARAQTKELEKDAKVQKAIQELLQDLKQLEQRGIAQSDLESLVDEGYSMENAKKIIAELTKQGVYTGTKLMASSEFDNALATAKKTLGLGAPTPAVAPPAEDFLYRGDNYGQGVITPINSFDRAMGVMYGKPNGPFDRAGRYGGGGGGYASNVVINIHGDPMTITRTVRKVLRSERERGYGGMGRTSSI